MFISLPHGVFAVQASAQNVCYLAFNGKSCKQTAPYLVFCHISPEATFVWNCVIAVYDIMVLQLILF